MTKMPSAAAEPAPFTTEDFAKMMRRAAQTQDARLASLLVTRAQTCST